MPYAILLSGMTLSVDDQALQTAIWAIILVPLGLGLCFYLLTRHVNRQFDRRPAVEPLDLDKDEAPKQ